MNKNRIAGDRKTGNKSDALSKQFMILAILMCIISLFGVILLVRVNDISKRLENIESTGIYTEDIADENESVHQNKTEQTTEASMEVSTEQTTGGAADGATQEDSSETSDSSGEGKTIYLTFDDGPSGNTRTVLDILDEYGVKATFFVVKPYDEDLYSLYKEIIDRGHTLGIHSYSHDYGVVYSNIDAYIADVQAIRNLVFDNTGYMPDIYRFPGGSSSELGELDRRECIKYLNGQGIIYFDWNCSSKDASSGYLSYSEITENVLSTLGIFDETIVLMHDSEYKTSTMVALPRIIEGALAQGYTFKSITRDTTPVQQILATGVE